MAKEWKCVSQCRDYSYSLNQDTWKRFMRNGSLNAVITAIL